MAQDYPYDGCCPHGPNAHTRDHCTACGCVKPPMRVDQPPTREAPTPPEAEPGDVADFRECTICWALILEGSREKHLAKHESDIETTHRLLMMITNVDKRSTHERD